MEKEFTQEDVDRIVGERLQRERKGFDAQLQKAMAEAAMTEQERLETRMQEREMRIQAGERALEAADLLKQKGLPLTLVDMLTADAPMAQRVSALDEVVREHVQRSVEEKLRGSAPKKGSDEDAVAKAFRGR